MWRKSQALKEWRLKNPLYAESCRAKQKLWRQNHSNYWKKWRKVHPAYVARNCKLQKARDAKERGFLAKRNEWKLISLEKLAQIRKFRDLAKGNGWEGALELQIDGILRYLQGQLWLAKQNDIDRRL